MGEEFPHYHLIAVVGAAVEGRLTSSCYPVSPVKLNPFDPILRWQFLRLHTDILKKLQDCWAAGSGSRVLA